MLSKKPSDITEVLTKKVAVISAEEAVKVAAAQFGIKGSVDPLTSERDQNFHLQAEGGKEYVLKITNPAEDRAITNFQTQALLHIHAVDPGIAVPKVFAAKSGEHEPLVTFSDGSQRITRVLSWLPGVPLYQVERTATLRQNLGRTQARLDRALRGFYHPAAGHELLWDIKHSARLRPLLAHIADKDKRNLAERYLDNFEQYALPVLPRLRGQVIHNDFQSWNVLVDGANREHVAGVIDFGDLVHAPMIDDLAVACAYHLSGAEEPLDHAAEVVAAYHSVYPLEREEVDILFDLIAVRLVMTVCITGWRAALHPENAAYILRNNPLSWTGLERFSGMTRGQAQAVLRDACGME